MRNEGREMKQNRRKEERAVSASLIRARLAAVRRRMKEEGVALYMLRAADFHHSDQLSPYFRTIEYLSGFSGNEARMVITENHAHLWTEGRYAEQVKRELYGSGIIPHLHDDREDEMRDFITFFAAGGDAVLELMSARAGTLPQLAESAAPQYIIGFDGRTFTCDMIDDIIDVLGITYDSRTVGLNPALDLVGDIWRERPPLPRAAVRVLPAEVAGGEAKDKIAAIRDLMAWENGTSCGMVITDPGDIAWLLNLRGEDLPFVQAPLSYAYLTNYELLLFIDARKLSEAVRCYLRSINVSVLPYDRFYAYIEEASEVPILVDLHRQNAAVGVTAGMKRNGSIVHREDLIAAYKAVKSEEEIEGFRRVHRADGVAAIRFLKWVKESFGKVAMDEGSLCAYLELLQQEQGAVGRSRATGALCGKRASIPDPPSAPGTPVTGGLLRIASGALYKGGTAVFGRTVALGAVSAEEKRAYTLALASLLELSHAQFRAGTNDDQLDLIARAPLWKHGLDYPHSTGTGIGYMIGGAEGPQELFWEKEDLPSVMREGMVTGAGPAVYEEGEYGVLHRNALLTVFGKQKGFLTFDCLTLVPFDPAALNPAYLTVEQREMLNSYQAHVYETMAPLLTEEERAWLRRETEAQ